jgi:medium-chain acyl-[acyl-carrier-protein] hydrolase
MEPIFEATQAAPPHEMDFLNRLKLSAFFNLMQSAASDHAEGLGLGRSGLEPVGIFWVLAWVRIEVNRYPRYRDAIHLATWPHRPHRIFSLRDFTFHAPDGLCYARARSAWLLVDAASQRITSLERLPGPVPYQTERSALAALPEKLAPPQQGEWVLEKEVSYSDLDLLQHMNSARYVQLVADSYPLEFHRRHEIAALTISYSAESRYGERLRLLRQENAESGTAAAPGPVLPDAAVPGAHALPDAALPGHVLPDVALLRVDHLAAWKEPGSRLAFQAVVEWRTA